MGPKGKVIRQALPHRTEIQAESPDKIPRKTETSFALDSSDHTRWPALADSLFQAGRRNKGTAIDSSSIEAGAQTAGDGGEEEDKEEMEESEKEGDENEQEEKEEEEEGFKLLASMNAKGSHREDDTLSDSEVQHVKARAQRDGRQYLCSRLAFLRC